MNKSQPITLPQTAMTSQFPGMIARSASIESLMHSVLTQNDYHAFQKLFNGMYSPLCQFCLKFVHVREVAEEVVSDVFYNIWKNRGQLEVSSPKAYLFTAVRNRAFDHLRKIKNTTWCDLDEATGVASESSDSQQILIQQEFSGYVEQSIARLPRQCRLIFELSREQGLKYKEIAEKLNISIKTVETQMGRALKHLRCSLLPS